MWFIRVSRNILIWYEVVNCLGKRRGKKGAEGVWVSLWIIIRGIFVALFPSARLTNDERGIRQLLTACYSLVLSVLLGGWEGEWFYVIWPQLWHHPSHSSHTAQVPPSQKNCMKHQIWQVSFHLWSCATCDLPVHQTGLYPFREK